MTSMVLKSYFNKLYINLRQEFALFAFVGLMTDFFLQIIFFVTTLSIDIRRMEVGFLVFVLK